MCRILLAALAAILILCCAGCSTSAPQPPKITVTAGDTAISTVITPDEWGSSEGRGAFLAIMRGKDREDVPYVRLGEQVTITFDGPAPGSAEMQDRILRPDGSGKYDDRVTEAVSVKLESNQCVFTLGANMAALLSSNSTDYEPGATIRGFRLDCTWGGQRCEYAFILRTDAADPTGGIPLENHGSLR